MNVQREWSSYEHFWWHIQTLKMLFCQSRVFKGKQMSYCSGKLSIEDRGRFHHGKAYGGWTVPVLGKIVVVPQIRFGRNTMQLWETVLKRFAHCSFTQCPPFYERPSQCYRGDLLVRNSVPAEYTAEDFTDINATDNTGYQRTNSFVFCGT